MIDCDTGPTTNDTPPHNDNPPPNDPPISHGVAATVPEPATWTMMLLGFGGLGAALRRQRRKERLALA